MDALTLNEVVNGLSGFLLLALAAFVASVRPRRAPNLALVIFSAAFGLAFVVDNLWTHAHPTNDAYRAALNVGGYALVLAAAAVLALAATTPTRLGGRDALVALVSVPFVLVPIWIWFQLPMPRVAWNFGLNLLPAALWGALVVLALRYRSEADPGTKRRLAFMSGALALYPCFVSGHDVLERSQSTLQPAVALAGIGSAAVLGALWMWNADRSTDPSVARRVALVFFVAPVLAFASTFVPGGETGNNPGFGLSRVGGVLLLAYAILRHQLLDVDLRLQWTIRRGTFVGAFVGVFVVVAQVAQNFFNEQYGLLLGGVATGLLLFAIQPIQRFADRFAQRAIPLAEARRPEEQRVTAYRHALRAALADGRMTRPEERHLADLATTLGLDPALALRLREEVEAEFSPT